ncbi:alpha/beta hydrolase [Cesiribacter sp. SM1]|uniref:alpha/beta hydrolase n=1 Tax=Cesiribacter sp. SM1 TaxID=2861196 RepID=UPI001CD7C9E4|nr:alpha/beta hydrolase [Cesiribacter sp. SM1]
MQRVFFSLLLLLLSTFCFAQNTVSISGTIRGNALDSIALGNTKVAIGANGSFSFKPQLQKPQYQTLTYGQEAVELYLEPGKSLLLSFDGNNFPLSLRYSGELAIVNQYLLQQKDINQQVQQYLSQHWGALFSKQEPAFIATLDSLRNLYLKPLNDLLYKDRSLHPWFLTQQRTDLTYPFDRWLLMYPEVHRRYTGQTVSLSPKSEAHLYKADLNDPRLLEFESYKDFVRDYLYQIVQQEFITHVDKKGMDNKWLYAAFKTVPRVIKNRPVQEFWLYDYMYRHLEDYGVKNIDSLYTAFTSLVRNPAYRNTIKEMYEQQKQEREKMLSRVYREVDGHKLLAFITQPEDLKKGERRPAMVYVHGGSGNMGKPDWHFTNSPHGFVSIAVEYRLRDRQGTLPPEQVSDIRAFFRWLRQHADELGIDTSRIVASGNSNGGFLLLNAAMAPPQLVQKLQASAAVAATSGDVATTSAAKKGEELNPAPNAVILQAAGFDATVNNWWDKYVSDQALVQQVNPTEHVRAGLPPMLVIHGTEDQSVPYSTAKAFVEKMEAAGNPIEFLTLEGSPHHLWAIPYFNNQAKAKQEAWLRELGYIK